MYSVSQKYVEAMKRPVQRHRIKGTVNGVAFTEDNILSGSFTITGQCSDTSNVQIGQVYTSELKITLLKGLPISRYTLMGSEIIPHFGLRLDTGAYEYIPLGVFTVSSASWAASGVEITAYDNMSKLDRSFSSSSLTGTPYELLTLACTSCGLELAMRSRDFNSLANGRRILTLFADNDIDTWRDCVSWIAQACCCNVFADRYGKIILKAYNQNVTDRIDTEHRLTGSTFGDYETHYTGLSVVDIEKQMTVYYSEPEDNGLTYNLGSNPFLQTDSDELREEMCREILTAMDQIHYVPFTVDMIGNPAYDLMDILCFEGGFADSSKISCITKYTFHYARMGDLASKVTAALGGSSARPDAPAEKPASEYYRVRKDWSDSKSQKGAYKNLANAKKCADANPGYSVFDADGNVVYAAAPAPEPETPVVPFLVKVGIGDLNIRTGPGSNYSKTGFFTGRGCFTILQVKKGPGSDSGWGRLKSGAGWISLDHCTKL